MSSSQTQNTIGILLYNTEIHQTNNAVKSRHIALQSWYLKTLIKFTDLHKRIDKRNPTKVDRLLIHNFLSCNLSNEKFMALSYVLITTSW